MIKKVYMTYSEDDPAFIGVFKRIKCQSIEKEKVYSQDLEKNHRCIYLNWIYDNS